MNTNEHNPDSPADRKTNDCAVFGGLPEPVWESEYHRLKAQADAINERNANKLREQGIRSVILLRCSQCLTVPQQNHAEFGGGECGGCIAKERDALRKQLSRTALQAEPTDSEMLIQQIDDKLHDICGAYMALDHGEPIEQLMKACLTMGPAMDAVKSLRAAMQQKEKL